MNILVYDQAQEPITHFLLEHSKDFSILPLSLSTFLDEVEVFDEISAEKTSLSWSFRGQEIHNDSNYCLINRVFDVPPELFLDFHEEDRSFVRSEFQAYLQFALSVFPHTLGRAGAYGMSADHRSLPQQWKIFQKHGLVCPDFYLGDPRFSCFSSQHPRLVQSQPDDLYFWKQGEKTSKDLYFSFLKPAGKAVFCLCIGRESLVFPHEESSVSPSCKAYIQKKSMEICSLLSLEIAEILWFVEKDQARIGMYSAIPRSSFRRPFFPSFCSKAFPPLLRRISK